MSPRSGIMISMVAKYGYELPDDKLWEYSAAYCHVCGGHSCLVLVDSDFICESCQKLY